MFHKSSLPSTDVAPARRAHRLSRLLPLVRILSLALVFSTALFFLTVVRSHTTETVRTTIDGLSRQLGWVTMPAGARCAYFGIHGGTVPVSLLATKEGTGLVVFVGRTGNDFLDLLQRAETRVPSLLNATQARESHILPRGSFKNTRHLMAGSASASLPVFSISADGISGLTADANGLQPFGLSAAPLSIEGTVAAPDTSAQAPRYHLLVDPRYLQPRLR